MVAMDRNIWRASCPAL